MSEGWLPRPSAPAHRAPPGATDCHHHVYDGRFPLVPGAQYRPGDATADDYAAFRARIGFARSVVIQPSVYGTDNACTLDAVARLGAGRARAIAVVSGDEDKSDLAALGRGGVVGVRLQAVGPSRGNVARLERLAARVDEMGWHLQLHLDPDLLVDAAPRLQALPVTMVLDHFGRIPHPDGVAHPAFAVAAGLVERGRTWVKLSAGYHFSRSGPPGYADVGALTRAFLRLAPERMLWATDWPHPTEAVKPDISVLLDRFVEWAGDDATARRVLVDNPATLYGFG
jgi:predicted TIM-barrel fold metal-dependent hydrolase